MPATMAKEATITGGVEMTGNSRCLNGAFSGCTPHKQPKIRKGRRAEKAPFREMRDAFAQPRTGFIGPRHA